MSNPGSKTSALLENVNTFLKTLYDPPPPLSDILRDRGLSDEEIARSCRYLPQTLYDTDTPQTLSDILRDQGVSDEDVARLYRDHLDTYLVEFLRCCTSWMVENLPERRSRILARCYGLDCEPKSTLTSLAKEYGISRERIRQLRQSALRRLMHRKRKQELEQMAFATAQSFLRRGDVHDQTLDSPH